MLTFLLGLAGGVLAARIMYARQMGWGASLHGRPGGGRFHPGQILFLARELHLDTLQREQVKDILRTMQRLSFETRLDQRERLEALADSLTEDRFDRARVEGVIAAELEKEATIRREILDRVELFHAGLTSAQREILKRHIGHSEEKHDGGEQAPA